MKELPNIYGIRKRFLDLNRSTMELYTAVEEFLEDPSQSTLETLSAKIKGYDAMEESLRDSVIKIIKHFEEQE